MPEKPAISNSKLIEELQRNHIVESEHTSTRFAISGSEFHSNGVIKNVVFNDDLVIKNVHFYDDLLFDDCIFKGTLQIVNSSFYRSLKFTDCSFEKDLIFNDNQLNEIKFERSTLNTLSFGGILNNIPNAKSKITFGEGKYHSTNFNCRLIDCEIEIKGGCFEDISFLRNKLNNSFTINGGDVKIKNIHIQSCDFLDRVDFLECNIESWLSIHKVAFHEQVVFNAAFKANSVRLTNVDCKHDISIAYNGNISSLDLTSCSFDTSFECYDYGLDEIPAGNEELSCRIDGVMKGNVIIRDIIVPSISISCVNLGTITFRNISTHLITLEDFQNHNKLVIANLRLIYNYNILIVIDSNINLTEFVNIDFRRFQEIVIVRSEVSNILLSNSILPPRVQIATKHPSFGYGVKPDEKINDNTYFRETYRQLKIAMIKQGNTRASLIFKSKELHYLRKEVSWGWDKLLLYLNYFSNNHGLSWIRGVFFTFIISIVFFMFYQGSLSNAVFNWGLNYSLVQTQIAFKDSLLPFTDFITSFPGFKMGRVATWQSNMIIILSRIFIGYGIYQTIIAFRKYGN